MTREPVSLRLVSAGSCAPLAEALASAYETSRPWVTVHVETYNTALAEEALRNGDADVALLSWMMPASGDSLWSSPIAVDALAGVARKAEGTVAMLTAQPAAQLPRQADLVVTLTAQTMAQGEQRSSVQAMGSVFEQALWILFDALVPQLQGALGQTAEDLRRRHTNMESAH